MSLIDQKAQLLDKKLQLANQRLRDQTARASIVSIEPEKSGIKVSDIFLFKGIDISLFYRGRLEKDKQSSFGEDLIQLLVATAELSDWQCDQVRVAIRGRLPQLFQAFTENTTPSKVIDTSNAVSSSLTKGVSLNIIERWSERDKTSPEKSIDFLRRVYKDQLQTPDLRAQIGETDPSLYNALAAQVSRKGIPDDLTTFFGERSNRRGTANKAELKRLGVNDPRDAFELNVDRLERQRLYQAARNLRGKEKVS